MKGWLTLMKKIVSIVLVILTLAALMIPVLGQLRKRQTPQRP